MFKHILIATDGSDHSQRTAKQGLMLARALGAKATAVYVMPTRPSLMTSLFTVSALDERVMEQIEASFKSRGDRAVDEVVGTAKVIGIECKKSVLRNDEVWKGILDTA